MRVAKVMPCRITITNNNIGKMIATPIAVPEPDSSTALARLPERTCNVFVTAHSQQADASADVGTLSAIRSSGPQA